MINLNNQHYSRHHNHYYLLNRLNHDKPRSTIAEKLARALYQGDHQQEDNQVIVDHHCHHRFEVDC